MSVDIIENTDMIGSTTAGIFTFLQKIFQIVNADNLLDYVDGTCCQTISAELDQIPVIGHPLITGISSCLANGGTLPTRNFR